MLAPSPPFSFFFFFFFFFSFFWLAQAHEIQIITHKPLPMQVDGEPCYVAPCKIFVSLKNQVGQAMIGKFPANSFFFFSFC